ncbi:MAG TPA: TonB-dependent receptor [Caulobacteraceae bacterium]|jgi:outer membrane receptor protein involved in Fe transport|nr:TonB-dependent receptor [Caulobacteraceae bacterium]
MKAKYMISCAAAAILGGSATIAFAQTASPAAAAADSSTGIQEVVVTAQRRNETLEKVPMTVQAFTGGTLSKLNITTLTDLLKYTPNVTYGSNGPGQGTIFMRGLSAGEAGNQSSATVGNFPNVAVYLDDQSMQFPGRNADIFVADMERVEVLEGPQGTLFGGGAEAGAIRYITNKPKLNLEEGNVEASYGFTAHGADNNNVIAVLNVPLIKDHVAVRGVIYNDRQGGYIDNVSSTFTRSNQDNNSYFGITPTGGLCPNGQPAGHTGFCTISNATAERVNNSAIAQPDQNPVTHTGGRLEALFQVNNDWDVLISESLSDLDAEGLSVEYPTGSDFQPLKPLQVTAFTPAYDKDNIENTAWTVNGKISDFKLVYTGAYTDRRISQQMDYTNYSRTLYGQYYECTGGTSGLLGKGTPLTCYSPVTSWHDAVHNTHLSNEVRLSTPDDWRLRGIVGVYHEDFRIDDVMNFNYKTIPSCENPSTLAAAVAGGLPCLGNVQTFPGSTANDPGVRGDAVGFGEDVQRGYSQTAVFGSADFDIIPDVLTITAGTRWYDYDEDEKGSVYSSNSKCLNIATTNNPASRCGLNTNIDAEHLSSNYTGFKSRFGLQYKPTKDLMFYYLFSQGFRPGGFSRSARDKAPDANGVPQFKTPLAYSPDRLTNNEIGAKAQLFDHRLQLNVSAYYMQWDNVQIALYQPCCLGNTTFLVNGPGYTIKGIEAQFIGRPMEGLTIQGSATYNDNTQSNSPCLVDNEPASPNLGQCITEVKGKPFVNPFGVQGGVSAFSPHFQANIRAHYDWMVNDFKAFATLGGSYTGEMFTQPANYTPGSTPSEIPVPDTTYLRYELPAYATMDGSIGFGRNNWTFQIVGENLLDSDASTFTGSVQFIKSEVPLRPRVISLKITAGF